MKRVADALTLPIAVDPAQPEPVHCQLYQWFQRAIVSGQLRPGQRIPATRTLAFELKLSRTPVLQAFDQLKAEGYIEAQIGAATRVSRSIPHDALTRANGLPRRANATHGIRRIARPPRKTKGALLEPWLGVAGAFRPHLPALDQFPLKTWSRLLARHARSRTDTLLKYGDARGFGPFREVLAHYLRTVRGVRCEPDQVMVVSGSQQGLYLCARVLLDPGDSVWIEEPGYPGAHQAFAATRTRIVPVRADAEGIVVQDGVRRSPGARAVYVTPAHQYPLGATLSATRRLELLSWATRAGAWIIEDDYDSEFRQGLRPVAALQGLDDDARVLYVGTFSKALFPALRVGYVVVPKDLITAFSHARDALDAFPAPLVQAALADFIREGHFARHVRRMRVLYTARCNALVEALQRDFGPVLEIANGETGMHLVVRLPPGLSDVVVSRKAAANGVSAMPLSRCCLRPLRRGGLVLGYGSTDPAQIRDGVRRLRATVEAEMSPGAFRVMARSPC